MAQNYLYSTRDHLFILKEWLDLEKILSYERFNNVFAVDDVDTILTEALKGAKEVVAPSNDENDSIGAVFENGKVKVPEDMKKAYHFIQENGWGSCNSDKNYEGALPRILYYPVLEYYFGANHGLACYYMATSGAAELIQMFGDEHLNNLFSEKMFSGQWAGTMCLTEPGAGSDVGDMLSRAYPTDTPGMFKIKATKCFITGGEQDFTQNIVHLLLARVEGAAPGTSGVSLFAVPKIWVNEDGSMGKSNDVNCVSIEHKMGLKGSATCVMAFGEESECYGWLLGSAPDEKGKAQGMKQMFHMMNGARLEMGVGAVSGAAVAYYNAAEYAAGRIQGKLLTNPKAGRVPIIQHEDIRRMLLDQKAHIEAMRALLARTFYYMDMAENDPDPEQKKLAQGILDIHTPICKAYNSDMAWELTAEAMQVYGGYGYSEEYPIAQLCRDVKIHSIWEGTNFIQSLDLVARKWALNEGKPFNYCMDDIKTFIASSACTDVFKREADILDKAHNAYQAMQAKISEYMKAGQASYMAVYATRILHATAKLFAGKLILEQAVLAQSKLNGLANDHYDYPFYQGKVEAARYYVRNIVPEVWELAYRLENADSSVLDIKEEAFFF